MSCDTRTACPTVGIIGRSIMHELSIAVALLEAARGEAESRGSTRIVKLRCRVGVARQVIPDMLRDAFEIAREGTPASDAALEVETVGMNLSCRSCGETRRLDTWAFECPACGSSDVALSGGDELELCAIELEVPDD